MGESQGARKQKQNYGDATNERTKHTREAIHVLAVVETVAARNHCVCVNVAVACVRWFPSTAMH